MRPVDVNGIGAVIQHEIDSRARRERHEPLQQLDRIEQQMRRPILVKRMALAAVEGMTLGLFTQPVFHATTGYLAFLTLVLFFIGLTLLPSRSQPSHALLSLPPS